MPLRRPAHEAGWHGQPAVRMSTGSAAAQSAVLMSPRLGTSGYRYARIFAASGSTSATQASEPPDAIITAWSSPPYPVQNEPIRG